MLDQQPNGAAIYEVGTARAVFSRMREEALLALSVQPQLARLFHEVVLGQSSLETAVVARLSMRLATDDLETEALRSILLDAASADVSIGEAMHADLAAILSRDPATARWIEPVLYYKGFHAIQTHRFAHWLKRNGKRDLALYLQSRSSEVFQCDINPAAVIGKGIFLDHGTGFVVGETAVIDDDVSILHDVTLGGTGKEKGDRHPKIRRGVLLCAGARVLGNIVVGECSRVAAGSVVLHPVPSHVTVAGVPAVVVGRVSGPTPSKVMDQTLDEAEFGGG